MRTTSTPLLALRALATLAVAAAILVALPTASVSASQPCDGSDIGDPNVHVVLGYDFSANPPLPADPVAPLYSGRSDRDDVFYLVSQEGQWEVTTYWNVDGKGGDDTFCIGFGPTDYVPTDNITIRGGHGNDTVVATQSGLGTNTVIDLGADNDSLLTGNPAPGANTIPATINAGTGHDTLDLGYSGCGALIDVAAGEVWTYNAQTATDYLRTLITRTTWGYYTTVMEAALSVGSMPSTGTPMMGLTPQGWIRLMLCGSTGSLDIAGFETYRGTASTDLFIGSASAETFYGETGDDLIIGGAGADRLYGGGGDDVISGEDGWDDIDGGEGDDFLSGGNGRDDLFGSYGDDLIHGGDSTDHLRGGAGNDDLAPGNGEDVTNGESGTDVLSLGISAPERVIVDMLDGEYLRPSQNLTGTFSAIENVVGTEGVDKLRGDHGRNYLWGLGGDDILKGRGGNDTLVGGMGHNVLDGGSGSDTCREWGEITKCENGDFHADPVITFPQASNGDLTVPSGCAKWVNATVTDEDFKYYVTEALTYDWTVVSRPSGSEYSFSHPSSEDTTFEVSKYGTYRIHLRVDDAFDRYSTKTLNVTFASCNGSGGF